MASYDYKEGKKRVEAILDNELKIIEQDKLPAIDKLTFDNAYKSWVSAIFVDIRNSTALFTEEDKEKLKVLGGSSWIRNQIRMARIGEIQ